MVEKKEGKDERKKRDEEKEERIEREGARKEGRKEKPNLEDEDKTWAINDYIITDWHR